MGTLTGQVIVDRAWAKANDATGTRYTSAEALMWINDGHKEIVSRVPSAYTKRALVTPAVGTRQTMAGMGITDGIQFVDVPRNYSADGVAGKPITKSDKAFFDDGLFDWHTGSGTRAWHWMASEDEPDVLWLWPAVTSAKVEVIYSAIPPALTSLSQTINLPDIYANALQFWLLHSFFSKDAEHNKGAALATNYFQLFLDAIGQRDKTVRLLNASSDEKAQR